MRQLLLFAPQSQVKWHNILKRAQQCLERYRPRMKSADKTVQSTQVLANRSADNFNHPRNYIWLWFWKRMESCLKSILLISRALSLPARFYACLLTHNTPPQPVSRWNSWSPISGAVSSNVIVDCESRDRVVYASMSHVVSRLLPQCVITTRWSCEMTLYDVT